VQDGRLTGSWTLDPARSQVLLETRHTWGLLPLHGVFRQVTGNGTVTEAGQVAGTFTAGSIDTKNKMRQGPAVGQALRRRQPPGHHLHRRWHAARRRGRPGDRQPDRPWPHPPAHPFDAKISATASEVRVDAEVAVNRADFGLTYSPLRVAPMNNTIVIHAVFTRQ
jgi:polyisoprenoid-binding protein YceI